jgi:hypothetical protein
MIDGREHIVARLISESVEQSPDSQEHTRHYKVLTETGLALEVLRSSDGKWYLESGSGDTTISE